MTPFYMDYTCPECGGPLLYEISTKMYVCKKCGLYVSKQQLIELSDKKRLKQKLDTKKEYLNWWLNEKKS